MVVRLKLTRAIGWVAAGAGVALVAGGISADERWITTGGAVMAGGGMLTGLWSGSMVRRRCRGVEDFNRRYSKRSTAAGTILLSVGVALSIAGPVVASQESLARGEDAGFYNFVVGIFGFLMPGLVLTSAGTGLLVMGYRRRENWPERVQAWIGPGYLTMRTSW